MNITSPYDAIIFKIPIFKSVFSPLSDQQLFSRRKFTYVYLKKRRNFNKNKRKIMVLRFLFSVNLIKCDKGAYSVGFLVTCT
mgnify:CR=1 FL=1